MTIMAFHAIDTKRYMFSLLKLSILRMNVSDSICIYWLWVIYWFNISITLFGCWMCIWFQAFKTCLWKLDLGFRDFTLTFLFISSLDKLSLSQIIGYHFPSTSDTSLFIHLTITCNCNGHNLILSDLDSYSALTGAHTNHIMQSILFILSRILWTIAYMGGHMCLIIFLNA